MAAHPLIRRIVGCARGGGNFAGTLVFTLLPVLVLRDWAWGRRAWGSSCRSARPAGSWAPWRHRGSPGGSAKGRSYRRAPWSARSSCGLVPVAALQADRAVSLVLLTDFRIRLCLRCARLQHHAAHHAPAGVPAAAARQDECVHPVRRLGSDAAGGAGRRLPWRAHGPCASHVARRGVQPPAAAPVLFSPFPGMRKLPDSVETGVPREPSAGRGLAAAVPAAPVSLPPPAANGMTTSARRVRTVQSAFAARHQVAQRIRQAVRRSCSAPPPGCPGGRLPGTAGEWGCRFTTSY